MKYTYYTYVLFVADEDYEVKPVMAESSTNKRIAKQNARRLLNTYPRDRVMRIHLLTETPFAKI